MCFLVPVIDEFRYSWGWWWTGRLVALGGSSKLGRGSRISYASGFGARDITNPQAVHR